MASVALITGVSSGLGLELALSMLDDGWRVVGVSRRSPTESRWNSHASERNAIHVAGDVANEVTVDRAFAEADRQGELATVINCAGQGIFGAAGTYTRSDVEDVLRGNLIGTILFSEAAFSRFKASGGLIVNIMSTAAQVPRANEAIYCASKWGARGYTESLRLEAKGTKALVIAVYPGGMRTAFWKSGRGANPDTSKFMDPAEVATAVRAAMADYSSLYSSDVTINRR